MPRETSPAWYCLSAQPKREHIAAANIRSRMELEVFCPRITYTKNTRRRGKLRFTEALFSGYLFSYCEIRRHLRHLRAMPGIRNVVRYGEDIPIVPKTFIANLEARLPDQHGDVPDPVIEEGREVVVTEGPFQNFDAIVAGLIPARERVALLLEYLGRQLSVEVSVESVLVKQEQPKSNIFTADTGEDEKEKIPRTKADESDLNGIRTRLIWTPGGWHDCRGYAASIPRPAASSAEKVLVVV